MLDGLRLAVTTFTVAPVRGGRVDRATAGAAMLWAPVVGAALGAVLGAVALGLRWAHAPALLGAVVVVALGALGTRGLHLDGLADTVDGLGSYAGPERALEIMKKPDVGPFGVAAIVLTLLGQVAAIGALPTATVLPGLVVATATGRLAVTWACRGGVPAARPSGLGALVAGTTSWVPAAGLTLLVAAAAVWATHRHWPGPVAVAVALASSAGLVRHAVQRFGGVTGDVFGACVEVAATVTLAGLAWASA
ncbi:adenosylcobinamide-GDP ribazoletransferase [Longispora fulva]|uniref:Adenosylcobinamide-GDP ribazoletransferase n=1 Tax=Longispora fulva TaxID=619741 RepID=A0A8J7KKK3_9ACTN|nr:adenosylcobinamide-GDP ribazoletransferase [Longispora fulva]MBG6138229.1 adenosylcobinamide-GDP ribazoletransferase [Longispora fulva]GIG60481.1 adenosylcobinamide-GDP ribazoletransferase [Longispora fulva]